MLTSREYALLLHCLGRRYHTHTHTHANSLGCGTCCCSLCVGGLVGVFWNPNAMHVQNRRKIVTRGEKRKKGKALDTSTLWPHHYLLPMLSLSQETVLTHTHTHTHTCLLFQVNVPTLVGRHVSVPRNNENNSFIDAWRISSLFSFLCLVSRKVKVQGWDTERPTSPETPTTSKLKNVFREKCWNGKKAVPVK